MMKKTILFIMFLCLAGSATSFADIVYENDYEDATIGDGFPAWNWGGGAAAHETEFVDYEGSIVVQHTAVVNNTSGGSQNSRIGSNWGITLSGNTSSNPEDYWIAFDIKNVSGDWDPVPIEVWVLPGGAGYGSPVEEYAIEDGWVRVVANLGDMTRTWWAGANWDAITESDWTLEVGMPYPGESIADGVSFDQIILIDNLIITMGEEPPMPVSSKGIARKPYPSSNSTDVSIDVGQLWWSPGEYVELDGGTHDVFFGIGEANVTAATVADPMGTMVFDGLDVNNIELARLEYDTTYFWRVDEINLPANGGMTTGKVWNFSTEAEAIDLTFDNIVDVTADTPTLYYTSQEPNMTVNGSGLDDNDMHSTSVEDTMWLGLGAVPGDTWIQYEFDKIYKFHEILVWNYNEPDPGQGFGVKDVNISYSEDGQVWKSLGDLVEINIADGADGYEANTTVALDGAIGKFIKLELYNCWYDIPGGGLSEVRFSVIPTRAMNPDPEDEDDDVSLDTPLTWTAGRDADSHTVYIGSDPNEVKAGNAEVIADTQDAMYSPDLALAKTYYWKVDEVNDNEEYPVWDGSVWSFSTVNSILIDGFEEGYDDSDVNAVYLTWIDGYDAPENGSIMGNVNIPYLSETDHSGSYSCPMTYDNTTTADYSEVVAETANLPIATSDWSIGSPKKLTIWIMGDVDNVVGDSELYCKIGGQTATYGGSLDALTRDMWMQWDIDLDALGVNLSNIPEIAIGVKTVGTEAGSGVLLIDDIRLSGLDTVVASAAEIFIEAEDYTTINADMQVLTELEGASGGQYVGKGDGTGNALDPPVNDANTVIYNFEIVEDGVYQFDFRVYGYGGDNSFWLQIPEITDPNLITTSNGTAVNLTEGWINTNNMDGASNWHWDTVLSTENGNQDLEWHLAAGTYTLKVGAREDGYMLDAMLISKLRDE